MRVVVLCLGLVLLGGCAETPVEGTDGADVEPATGMEGLSGRLLASLANTTVGVGVPFNVTLEFVANDATDADASGGNASGGGPNATSEGSGSDANATGDDPEANGTGPDTSTPAASAAMPWTVTFSNVTGNASYNGTGLPAVFQANLTLVGNVTMTAAGVWENATFTMEPMAMVVEAVTAAIDPCAGVPVQDTISRTGILGPGAANSGLVTSNNFEVGVCQVGMTVEVTTTTGASDIIIRLYTPDGEVDQDANFVGGETLVYAPAGGLTPGAYNAQVRPYAVVADQYQLTITFH